MSSSTFCPRPRRLSSLLLLLLLHLHAVVITASPNPQATSPPDDAPATTEAPAITQEPDITEEPVSAEGPLPSQGPSLAQRDGAFRNFPKTYEGRVERGAYFRMLMGLSNERAKEANDGVSVVSRYQDPDNAKRWGWYVQAYWAPFDDKIKPSFTSLLESDAFRDPAYRVNPSESGIVLWWHKDPFVKFDGSQGGPTGGFYQNLANVEAGAFIFDNNASPRAIQEKFHDGGDIPDLHRVHDFAFFTWYVACHDKRVDPKSLKVVFQPNIYDPAFSVIVAAVKELGHKRMPGWKNRLTIKMGTRQGDAILGSGEGSLTAKMLIQHKEILGVKEITEVDVWGYTPRFMGRLGRSDGFKLTAASSTVELFLRFVVEDVVEDRVDTEPDHDEQSD